MAKSNTYNQKKLWVWGLVVECPMQVPLKSCPAIALRELPLEERFAIVEGYSEEKLDDIIEKHKTCLENRER